jgi:hypothetical protein
MAVVDASPSLLSAQATASQSVQEKYWWFVKLADFL